MGRGPALEAPDTGETGRAASPPPGQTGIAASAPAVSPWAGEAEGTEEASAGASGGGSRVAYCSANITSVRCTHMSIPARRSIIDEVGEEAEAPR